MAKIGSYEIVDTLQGGAKPLYKAKAADGAIVALKVMPATGVAEEEKQRFEHVVQNIVDQFCEHLGGPHEGNLRNRRPASIVTLRRRGRRHERVDRGEDSLHANGYEQA